MIRIAICDDEKYFIEQIKNILLSYKEERICIEEFSDGVMLLDKFDCRFDIIFLDIKMPYIDGVKVAEKIRLQDKNVTIIFLTSLLGRAIDGYRVHAANFLIKPIAEERIIHEIEIWRENNHIKKQECLLVDNIEGQFRVPIASLRYVETYNRNLLLHSENQTILCYKKLKELKEKLDSFGFVQSHKCYLLNMAYVRNVSGNEIILITNEVIPVSRVMKKEFMERLARYMGMTI